MQTNKMLMALATAGLLTMAHSAPAKAPAKTSAPRTKSIKVTKVDGPAKMRPADLQVCPVLLVKSSGPGVTVVNWRGRRVHLCCSGCKHIWDKLSAGEKDAKVAAAMKTAKNLKTKHEH